MTANSWYSRGMNEFFSQANLHGVSLGSTQEIWFTNDGGNTDVTLWEEAGHHWQATVCPISAEFRTYDLGICRGPHTALNELNRQVAAELTSLEARFGLAELKQEAAQLWEPHSPSDEYFAAQLKYEQRVEEALNDSRLDDSQRQQIISEHFEAISGVWLDEHPQFVHNAGDEEKAYLDDIRQRMNQSQSEDYGYGV